MTHLLNQLLLQLLRRNEALFEHHECRDHFAAEFVGPANDARFRDRRMAKQGGLDFDGANAMTGNLDDLVGTAGKPNITILVDLCGITRVIDTRNNRTSNRGRSVPFHPTTPGSIPGKAA